jgi:hypothetical protein
MVTKCHFFAFLLFSTLMSTSHPFSLSNPPVRKTGVRLEASRRDFLSFALGSAVFLPLIPSHAADKLPFSDTLKLIQEARKQLNDIPDLIQAEKWDAVRAILITPPLADCWAKTNRPLLLNYAETLDDKGGDEFAALEAREEANSHLRYLDMAAYNNVFNPIKSEGKAGASKVLIQSYYEDPMNEWRASIAAIDDLIKLAP